MILVIDVGNTNTVLGLFDDKLLLEYWRIKTDLEEKPLMNVV